MKPCLLHPQAAEDVSKAVARYEDQQHGTGLDFLDALQSMLGEVSEAPTRWPKIQGALRRIVSRKVPYALLYADREDGVWVIGLMPLRRNPAISVAAP